MAMTATDLLVLLEAVIDARIASYHENGEMEDGRVLVTGKVMEARMKLIDAIESEIP